jgi:hypothetical protein
MEYMLDLKGHFKTQYPDYFIPSNSYQEYMDKTYSSFIPDSLKQHRLKIAIVFIHDTVHFEV